MPSATRRLFDIWEAVLPLSPARRALGLVAAMRPDLLAPARGELSVGERDGTLLRLRAAVFGTTISAVSRCQACDERVELSFEIDDVQVAGDRPDTDQGDVLVVEQDGWSVRNRLPSSEDIVCIERATSEQEATAELWRRCTLDVRFDGRPRAVDAIPEAVRTAMADRFATSDPQADVQIQLLCPACSSTWEQDFDISSFLWAEIDTWARRLLADVHVLARAYGWDEDQILALSPLRRRAYLEMVAA